MHRTPYVPAALALAAALSAGAAQAQSLPVTMNSYAEVRTCIDNCTSLASYTVDSHTVDAPFLAFSDLAVTAAVAANANAFGANASATTTLLGNSGFQVHLVVNQPTVGLTRGSYETSAGTNFSFQAGPGGGTLEIGYVATYVRPTIGPWLDTGVSFSSPSSLALFGGRSIDALSFDSDSGTVSGAWSYVLDADRFYSMALDANNTRAFTAPAGFGTDLIDVTYTVSLPFTNPVPEPGTAAMWLGGLLMGLWVMRRRSVGESMA